MSDAQEKAIGVLAGAFRDAVSLTLGMCGFDGPDVDAAIARCDFRKVAASTVRESGLVAIDPKLVDTVRRADHDVEMDARTKNFASLEHSSKPAAVRAREALANAVLAALESKP